MYIVLLCRCVLSYPGKVMLSWGIISYCNRVLRKENELQSVFQKVGLMKSVLQKERYSGLKKNFNLSTCAYTYVCLSEMLDQMQYQRCITNAMCIETAEHQTISRKYIVPNRTAILLRELYSVLHLTLPLDT